MTFACCSLCTGQFRDKDGKIDDFALTEVKAKFVEASTRLGASQRSIEAIKTADGSCLCDCHTKGSFVLH
jgi:hypothetical protein